MGVAGSQLDELIKVQAEDRVNRILFLSCIGARKLTLSRLLRASFVIPTDPLSLTYHVQGQGLTRAPG